MTTVAATEAVGREGRRDEGVREGGRIKEDETT